MAHTNENTNLSTAEENTNLSTAEEIANLSTAEEIANYLAILDENTDTNGEIIDERRPAWSGMDESHFA